MVRVFWFSCLFALMAFLTACGGGGDDGGTTNNAPPPDLTRLSLNISDARGLVITDAAGSTVAKAAAAEQYLDPSSIYKVTQDGQLVKVTPSDADGVALPAGAITPTSVAQLSERFLRMVFFNSGTELVYLVDTYTGRAFLEDGAISALRRLNAWTGTTPSKLITDSVTSDHLGNLYLYCGSWGSWEWEGLCKIDTTKIMGGGDVTVEELTRDVGANNIDPTYQVSGDGRFFLYRALDGNIKLRPVGQDGYEVLPAYLQGFGVYGYLPVLRGLDGEIYAAVLRQSTDTNKTLYRIDLGVNTTTGGPSVVVEEMGPWEGAWLAYKTRVVAGKLLVVSGGIPSMEIDIAARRGTDWSATVKEGFDSLFALDGWDDFLANDRDVFIFGTLTDLSRAVRRWDPTTGTVVTFNQLGSEFDIEKIKILGGGDVVWFEATRRADSSTLIGELAVDGTVTELQTITAAIRTIDVLTPINPAHFIAIDGQAGDWGDELILLSGTTQAADINRIGVAEDRGTIKMLIELNAPLTQGLQVVLDTQPDLAGGEYYLRYNRALSGKVTFELFTPSGQTVPLTGNGWLLADGGSVVEVSGLLETLSTPTTFDLVVSLGSYSFDNLGNVTGFTASQSTQSVNYVVP